MNEQFTAEELDAISRALNHLEGDYPEISDQLRQLRDSEAFKSAKEKIERGQSE
jgi:hypothetical protein